MQFEVLSPRRATLVVPPGRRSEVGRVHGPRPQQHRLGVRGAARYTLTQPYSPDDEPWAVQVGPGADPASPALPNAPWAAAWSEFLRGSRATVGVALPLALPAGRYAVVRTDQPIEPTDRVLLGNMLVPAPANVGLWAKTKPVYVAVFGPEKAAPPATDQPLLGFALLNQTGEKDWDGLWCFAMYRSPPPAAPAPGAQADVVLIVPLDGELVLDNMASFNGPEGEAAALAAWQDRAENLIRWFVRADEEEEEDD